MVDTPEPRTSENVAPHLMAEADQLQAVARAFAEADERLIAKARELPGPDDAFWASPDDPLAAISGPGKD